jgi:hypothetical protein
MTRKDDPAHLKTFLAIFRDVVLAFQPRGLERDTAKVYYDALGDLPVPILRASAKRLTQTQKFFPTTGEWREAALAIPPSLGTAHGDAGIHDADRWTFHECPAEPCDRTQAHGAHWYARRKKF